MIDDVGNVNFIDFNASSKLGQYRDYLIGTMLYKSPLAHNLDVVENEFLESDLTNHNCLREYELLSKTKIGTLKYDTKNKDYCKALAQHHSFDIYALALSVVGIESGLSQANFDFYKYYWTENELWCRT